MLVAKIDGSFKSSDRTHGARRVWQDVLREQAAGVSTAEVCRKHQRLHVSRDRCMIMPQSWRKARLT